MIYAPKNTLAYHATRIVHEHKDMGALNTKKVMQAVKPIFSGMQANMPSPEALAVTFYGLNHAMALISARHHPLEPLPASTLEIVETYHRTTCINAVRCWHYLLFICARESRHTKFNGTHLATMEEKFGVRTRAFMQGINHMASMDVVEHLISDAPDIPIGTLTECLAWNFHNGHFSSGYGGPAWGNVADCLDRYVRGQTSCEIMMDTVWTLAHNGGPIFNKGMTFKMYGSNLLRILDVQRGGQIPEAVLYDKPIGGKNAQMQTMMHWLKAEFPDKVGDYVDWVRIKALGAVGEYPTEIAHQKKLYGTSAHEASAQKLADAKAAIEAANNAKLKANEFEVMPGLVLHKFIRPKLAA